jgi:N-acyl-D-aspartate/D-glutamate deacylase
VARTGVPLSLSLAQSHRQPEAWRGLLARIEAAVAEGLPIRAQVAPRPVGLLVGLQSSYHPFLAYRAYQDIAALPVAGQARALRDPAFRSRLLADMAAAEAAAEGAGARDGERRRGRPRPIDYQRLYPLGEVPDYEPAPETSVLRLAAARGVEPAALMLDLLSENDGRNFLYTPFSNYADGNLDACGEMLAHPHTILGLGDGGAHVGLISDASFPTYALSHWARDRAHGRMEVGRVVEQLTSATAAAVGLHDRGILAEGMRADVNVIDFERLRCAAPVMAYDLPAGGKRLLQGAHGYRATVVAGAITYRDGEPTGALPGRLVRGGRDTAGTRLAS